MDFFLTLILILLTVDVGANDSSSVSIRKEADATKLLPELKGLDAVNGFFGKGVAIDGEHMVISAPGHYFGGGFAIYKKESDQWVLAQMFDAANLPDNIELGNSVDIFDETIVLGARESSLDAENAGAIVIYQLNDGSWLHTQTITSPNSRPRGKFGSQVMLKENMAVITEDSGLDQPGIAYVYSVTGGVWQLTKQIDDIDLDWQLGTSELAVDFDDNHLVVSRSESGSSGALLRVYDLTDDTWMDYQELDPVAQSWTFGNAVAIEADRLIVGDYGINSDAGAVYFYEKIAGTWQLQQSLLPPVFDADKEFGSTVKLSGNQLLIGSYGDDEIAGAAGAMFYYEYTDGQWQESQKLLASDGMVFDRLGFYADLAGDELIVSAIYADAPSDNSGKVYSFLFANGSWNENQIINPLQAVPDKIFSNALALNDGWVAVGADGDDDQGNQAGAVYLYKKQSGELVFEEKLYADQAATDQQFGKNIVIENDVMLIGATGNRVSDGSVHYYQLIADQWVFQAKFKPANTADTDFFGYVLSLNNDWLAVTATGHINDTNTGAVYMFRLINNEWIESAKLTPSSKGSVTAFGFDLSLTSDRLAVGTWFSGKVFIFELEGKDWLQVHEIDAPDSNNAIFFGSSVNLYEDQIIINDRFSPLIFSFDGNSISLPELLDENINQHTRYIDVNNDTLVLTDSVFGSSDRSKTLVYQFINDSWQYIYELPNPPFSSFYKNDVAVYGREILVGDFNNSQRGDRNGAAYWIQEVGDLIFADGFE